MFLADPADINETQTERRNVVLYQIISGKCWSSWYNIHAAHHHAKIKKQIAWIRRVSLLQTTEGKDEPNIISN
jgi:hypothetical protein